ncbi:MAG: beta-propeller domain-containing protein [Oscillospiraceae bacterium]|nr:beta-propeller domain-containing protein [Oscillospiraceae bacterium]
MKRKLSLLLCCCLLVGLLAACSYQAEPTASTPPMGGSAIADEDVLVRFASSYEEVYQALETAKENMGRDLSFRTGDDMVEDAEIAAADTEGSLYYSGTNVQVEGVDEGDIVKTDGTYLYILREYELIIMQVNGAEVSETSINMVGAMVDNEEQENGAFLNSEKNPQELYLCGDRAVVVSTYYDYYEMPDGTSSAKNFTAVDIFDITDRAAPALIASLGQDGYTVASRMIDDTLYLVTSYYPNEPVADQEDTFAPCLYTGGERAPIECGSIGMIPNDDTMTFAVLCSYSIPDAGLISSQSILGGGDTVYMNAANLYLARLVYSDTVTETKQEDPYTVTAHTQSVDTVITRYDVADKKLTYGASGSVAGGLLNQFSLDEKDGNLRVVTTEDRSSFSVYVDATNDFENTKFSGTETANDLFVLDADLKTVGSVTGIAEGERVYAVRFQGDWGYLCTYRETDPIFAVDLSDPAAPKVTGEVKLTGYSDYLHVWNDELLFGLGMETQEIADENGVTATLDGMKMVMINKADPANLTEAGMLSVNADYSEALTNHKAILVDPARNLIAFPAESSYLIYGYTPEDGFTLKAEVAVSEWDWNNRGVVIGDYFYVCGSDRVNVIDLNTLENVGETIVSRG